MSILVDAFFFLCKLTFCTFVTVLAIGARTVEVRFRRPGATGAAVCVGVQRSLSCWEVP